MPLGSWYSQLPPFGWFDPQDRPGSAAYQVGGRSIPDSQQGIALPTRGGLGKWYNVTPPGSNRPFPLQQTDIGPDPRTGRGIDISAAGAHQMGYTPKNFPTDANFKAEPIDLTGLGLAAKWNGGVPGDNQTAVAEGPPPQQGRKMPNSLMDMFTPQDAAGQPTDLGGALTGRSNSLIGLGLGLLSPSNPLRGQSGWGQALEGYMGGAALDARQATSKAALAHQKTQDARQAAMDQFYRQNALAGRDLQERQFKETQLGDLGRKARDLGLVAGTPEHGEFMRTALRSTLGEQPTWGVIGEGATGKQYGWISPSKQTVTAGPGGTDTGPMIKPDDISGIRKEVSGLPETKRIGEAMPIFHSMVKTATDPKGDTRAGDLDFVYGMAKIFDPDSVVREGEMKLAQGAQTLPEDIKSMMSKVALAGGRLTPEARQRLLDVAEIRMGQLHNSYQTRIKPFTGIAERYRVNPADIMPGMMDMPTRAKPDQSAVPTATGPSAPARPANVPAGSAYSPSLKKWRTPDGKIFDLEGKPF